MSPWRARAGFGAAFMALAALACIFFGLAWLTLRALARSPVQKPTRTTDDETPGGRLGVVQAFAEEYRRVLRDCGAFGLIVIGPLLYGVAGHRHVAGYTLDLTPREPT